MSYEEAREQARFLTDKMAYELNLNDAQYNDAYEINLDYLMGLHRADDIYGNLTYRNADLRHILYDWQYTLFVAADYFFHPVYWRSGGWVFPIYNRYRIGHFYYDHPRVFWEYRGGHSRVYYPRSSFYTHRRPVWHSGFRGESRRPVNHPGISGPGRPDGNHRPGNSGSHPGSNVYQPNHNGHRPGNQPPYNGSARPDNNRPNTGNAQRPPAGTTNRPSTSAGNNRRPNQPQTGPANPAGRPTMPNGYQRQSSTRTTVSRRSSAQRSGQSPAQSSGASRGRNARR